jgi:ethanolamine ammonia-lyase small subunit
LEVPRSAFDVSTPSPSDPSTLNVKSSALNVPASAVPADAWSHLRRHTAARIALGRTGGSLPTSAVLAFAHDHALARDAVHALFDPAALATALQPLDPAPILQLTSAAPDRPTYLQRPDLGRRLSSASFSQLSTLNSQLHDHDLVVIVSDGLSALAAERQAPPLLAALLPRLRAAGLTLAPLCIVRHARVALQDELGALLRARLSLMLLGERPGLGTPDSLGAYFTFAPRPGRTDADRNCLSNIRPAGLPPAAAAEKLATLITAALRLGLTGTALKDESPPAPVALPGA